MLFAERLSPFLHRFCSIVLRGAGDKALDAGLKGTWPRADVLKLIMIAKLFVHLYLLVHGKLGLPGAGWLIRLVCPFVKGLHDFPLRIPKVGTAHLDFRDAAAFGLLNVYLGEKGDLTPLIKWMEKVLSPGVVLWDIGANVGYLDLYFAIHHPNLGALHAFEPNPHALRTLQSLFQNHPKVKVHSVGLGSSDEILELNAPRNGSPIGSLVRQFEGGERIRVQIRRGDAYCQEHHLPLPDVMKIDVEGFEPQVLAGLTETIRKKRPIIFFEYLFLEDGLLQSLVPAGYTLHLLLDDGSLTEDLSRRKEGHDAILVPEESRKLFREA
jgi:FkbM family methyltransferase